MSKTSFSAIYQKLGECPKYQAEIISLGFLAEVHQFMVKNDISKAELARRASVSPAYITKLFNGSTNLSVETMTKLAQALQCQVHLHLASKEVKVRWLDVYAARQKHEHRENMGGAMFAKMKRESTVYESEPNDERFAFAA